MKYLLLLLILFVIGCSNNGNYVHTGAVRNEDTVKPKTSKYHDTVANYKVTVRYSNDFTSYDRKDLKNKFVIQYERNEESDSAKVFINNHFIKSLSASFKNSYIHPNIYMIDRLDTIQKCSIQINDGRMANIDVNYKWNYLVLVHDSAAKGLVINCHQLH